MTAGCAHDRCAGLVGWRSMEKVFGQVVSLDGARFVEVAARVIEETDRSRLHIVPRP